MTVTFDENVQERDCVVLFKFNSEFNVCVTVIEIVQKLSCSVFTLGKQNVDCMTEKLNILRRSRATVMRLLSQTTLRQLVTT